MTLCRIKHFVPPKLTCLGQLEEVLVTIFTNLPVIRVTEWNVGCSKNIQFLCEHETWTFKFATIQLTFAEQSDGVNTPTLFSGCWNKRLPLTVTAGAVESLHGGVLGLPVRELQCGVQTPEAFSQRVVLVVLD